MKGLDVTPEEAYRLPPERIGGNHPFAGRILSPAIRRTFGAGGSTMFISTYEAAATLTVGTDALRNEQRNVASQPRVLRAVGMVGSAAINDTSVDLYIEDYFVGNFRNSTEGVVGIDQVKDMRPVGPHLIPAGSKISAIIRTAPTTNPLIIQLM